MTLSVSVRGKSLLSTEGGREGWRAKEEEYGFNENERTERRSESDSVGPSSVWGEVSKSVII